MIRIIAVVFVFTIFFSSYSNAQYLRSHNFKDKISNSDESSNEEPTLPLVFDFEGYGEYSDRDVAQGHAHMLRTLTVLDNKEESRKIKIQEKFILY